MTILCSLVFACVLRVCVASEQLLIPPVFGEPTTDTQSPPPNAEKLNDAVDSNVELMRDVLEGLCPPFEQFEAVVDESDDLPPDAFFERQKQEMERVTAAFTVQKEKVFGPLTADLFETETIKYFRGKRKELNEYYAARRKVDDLNKQLNSLSAVQRAFDGHNSEWRPLKEWFAPQFAKYSNALNAAKKSMGLAKLLAAERSLFVSGLGTHLCSVPFVQNSASVCKRIVRQLREGTQATELLSLLRLGPSTWLRLPHSACVPSVDLSEAIENLSAMSEEMRAIVAAEIGHLMEEYSEVFSRLNPGTVQRMGERLPKVNMLLVLASMRKYGTLRVAMLKPLLADAFANNAKFVTVCTLVAEMQKPTANERIYSLEQLRALIDESHSECLDLDEFVESGRAVALFLMAFRK